MTRKQLREFGRTRHIKIEIEDTDLLGIIVTVTGIKKRPDVELEIIDYVRDNTAYELGENLTLKVKFIGNLSELPIGARIAIKIK